MYHVREIETMSLTTIKTRDGKVWQRRTWTGGNTPSKAYLLNPKAIKQLRLLRAAFFRESLKECGGLDLWVCAGTSPLERARIFWKRATLDAWRTLVN